MPATTSLFQSRPGGSDPSSGSFPASSAFSMAPSLSWSLLENLPKRRCSSFPTSGFNLRTASWIVETNSVS